MLMQDGLKEEDCESGTVAGNAGEEGASGPTAVGAGVLTDGWIVGNGVGSGSGCIGAGDAGTCGRGAVANDGLGEEVCG